MTAVIVDVACPLPVERRPDNPGRVSSTFWIGGPSLGAVAFSSCSFAVEVFRTALLWDATSLRDGRNAVNPSTNSEPGSRRLAAMPTSPPTAATTTINEPNVRGT